MRSVRSICRDHERISSGLGSKISLGEGAESIVGLSEGFNLARRKGMYFADLASGLFNFRSHRGACIFI